MSLLALSLSSRTSTTGKRGALVVATLTTASALAVAPASAGGVEDWTKVSTGTVSATSDISTYYDQSFTPSLHALYLREGASKALVHIKVDPEGVQTRQNTILEGHDALAKSTVILPTTGGGLQALYGALDAGPHAAGQVYRATSADLTGGTWATGESALVDNQGYTADGLGAALLADGTPVIATTRNDTITAGVPGSAPVTFTVDSCCAYWASVVSDGTNAAVAWQGNGGTAGTTGVFARQVYPGLGATTFKAPGSSTNTGGGNVAAGMSNQATAAAIVDGVTYLAYPTGYPSAKAVRLYAVGGDYVTVPGSQDARNVALTHNDATGRFWIAWTTASGLIRAVPTGYSDLSFGAVRTLRPPRQADGLFAIAINGEQSTPHLLMNGGNGIYHELFQPGLQVGASPTSFASDRRTTVTFTVHDADLRVRGARVSAEGRQCTTGSNGRCTLTFPPGRDRVIAVKATAAKYYRGVTRLRVR